MVIKKIVAKELPVNKERLDTESLRGQELYAKFLDYKTNFAFLLAKANGDYKRLYREKWEYYGGKADAKVYATKPFDLKVLKTDLSVYIESDQEIHQACQLHATCETSVGRGTGAMEDYRQYVRKHLGKLCPWHHWV